MPVHIEQKEIRTRSPLVASRPDAARSGSDALTNFYDGKKRNVGYVAIFHIGVLWPARDLCSLELAMIEFCMAINRISSILAVLDCCALLGLREWGSGYSLHRIDAENTEDARM